MCSPKQRVNCNRLERVPQLDALVRPEYGVFHRDGAAVGSVREHRLTPQVVGSDALPTAAPEALSTARPGGISRPTLVWRSSARQR